MSEDRMNQYSREIRTGSIKVPEPTTFSMMIKSKEILRFEENGDIFIRGKLAENDKLIVEEFRKYFKDYYNER